MDDLITLAMTMEMMNAVVGEIHYCLGISIERDDKNCFVIPQYSGKVWAVRSEHCCHSKDANVQMRKDDGLSKPVNITKHQSTVGSLNYVESCRSSNSP